MAEHRETAAVGSRSGFLFAVDPRFLVPKLALGSVAGAPWPSAPLASTFVVARSTVAARPSTRRAPEERIAAVAPTSPAPPVRTVQMPPLPERRPAELAGSAAPAPERPAERRASRRTRAATLAEPAPETRSFAEMLFGPPRTVGPTLAYAALENGRVDLPPAPRFSPVPNPAPAPALIPTPFGGGGTAVYDINARTVTLPNGERLEAHSGLGSKLDDPRYVHVRMLGATPPGTYDLTEREQPFHGVRALRLNPIGGSGAVHGRAGLLAHTYMLGPNGDSNGCVSFRNYERFLQAYLRGEIRRLTVVTGGGFGFASWGARSPERPPTPRDT